MTQPQMDAELFYFPSCITKKENVEEFMHDDGIDSIYHVCGVHPWFLVCKTDSIDNAISWARDHELGVKYMSLGKDLPLENDCNEGDEGILFWVFVKARSDEGIPGTADKDNFILTLQKALDSEKDSEIFRLMKAYEIFGEYNYLVKVSTKEITGIYRFTEFLNREARSTQIKCVLSTVKENGHIIVESESPKEVAKREKEDFEYAMLRVIANTPGFINMGGNEQKSILEDKLGSMGIVIDDVADYILDPLTSKSIYSRQDLEHNNRFIDRFSIKLDRAQWCKALLFLRSTDNPGAKEKLERAVASKLLGVKPNQFARKFYSMTGDYDFIVPFDCRNTEILTHAIDDFCRDVGECIANFTNTICRVPRADKAQGALRAFDIPFIESLLINATLIYEFEDRIKEGRIFDSLIENKDLIPAEDGITPREDYARSRIKTRQETGKVSGKSLPLVNYLKKFRGFESAGIRTTVEYRSGAIIQALAKFYFTDLRQRNAFVDMLEDKIDEFEIIGKRYDPVRDLMTVMYILTVKELIELEALFRECSPNCRKIEFHILFRQEFYSSVLEQKIRCRPCFHPIIPEDGCKRDCGECKEAGACLQQNCGACIRYVLPRQRNRILIIDQGERMRPEVKATLVSIDMSLGRLLALEELLDQEGSRKKVFDRYKSFLEGLDENEAGMYETHKAVVDEYNRIPRGEFRKAYTEAICQILRFVLSAQILEIQRGLPHIVVFPEYTIPAYVANEIKGMDIPHECVIVAGSHIEDGFNTSPLIFVTDSGDDGTFHKEIYHYYKNNLNPFEEKMGLVTNGGTAYLKFINTIFGNLYFQICYDAYTIDSTAGFENVDILAVPSFNPSCSYTESLIEKAKAYKLVAIYANAVNRGPIKSRIFVPPNHGLEASRHNLNSFHKNQRTDESRPTNDPIFVFHPEGEEDLQPTKIGKEFCFGIKTLLLNPLELDIRRDIRSGRDHERPD